MNTIYRNTKQVQDEEVKVVHGTKTIGPVAGPNINSNVMEERCTTRENPTSHPDEAANPAYVAGVTTGR